VVAVSVTDALDLAAGLLALAVVTRLATAQSRLNLAAFAADALVGLVLAAILLLALGVTLELEVLYAGAAALAGAFWTGVAETRPRLRAGGLAASALAASAAVAAIVLAARAYQWWFALAGLLAAMGVGLTWQAMATLLRAPPPTAARGPPVSPRAPVAPAQPAEPRLPSAPPAASAKATVICPSCGLTGQVAAVGPPTLRCPRCGASVRRPGGSPPPGGPGGPRTPPPPRPGPSS
jgi:hypothetical protein